MTFSLAIADGLHRSICGLDREDGLLKLIGLQLMPALQSNQLRIETLLHHVAASSDGSRRPSATELANLLNSLNDHSSGLNEDPAEDVFVAAVSSSMGQYRIFTGSRHAPDFSLERMLEALETLGEESDETISAECHALLSLSEALAERAGLGAGSFEPSRRRTQAWPTDLDEAERLGRAACFAAADLAELGVTIEDLQPFILGDAAAELLDHPYGMTPLERYPLRRWSDGVQLLVPGAVSSALRLYLCHAMRSGRLPDLSEAFHGWQLSRWVQLSFRTRGATPLESGELPDSSPAYSEDVHQFEVLFRIDLDKELHLVFLGAGWPGPSGYGLYETRKATPGIAAELDARLRRVAEARRSSAARGLTLIVFDSPGWGFDLGTLASELDEGWPVVFCSAFSLHVLLAAEDFSFLNLWKMECDRRWLERRGIRVRVWPEILVYWGFWRNLGFTFTPRELDVREFGGISTDTSVIVDLVRESREQIAHRGVKAVNGSWIAVDRLTQFPVANATNASIHFSPDALVGQKLVGVVETAFGPWWLSIGRPPVSTEERQFFYLLWQGALEWLRRLATTAPLGIARMPLLLELLPVPDTIPDGPDEPEFAKWPDGPHVKIIFPSGLIQSLIRLDNSGERDIVRQLARAVLLARDETLTDDECSAWVERTTSDPDLKMIHVTYLPDQAYALDHSAPTEPLRLLQEADRAKVERWFRDDLAGVEAVAPLLASEIRGKAESKAVLECAVDLMWKRIQARLRHFDRASLLVTVSGLVEGLHQDRVDQERGARARRIMYAEDPAHHMRSMTRIAGRDMTFMSYRCLLEMALCEAAAEGGRLPGMTDIDAAAAEVADLIRLAHLSDAIDRDLVEPVLRFAGDGSIAGSDSDWALEFAPGEYQMATLGEFIERDVEGYESFYPERDDEAGDPIAEPDADGFFHAVQEELGLSLHDIVEILQALLFAAAKLGAHVVDRPRSELVRLLESEWEGFDPAVLDRFLISYGLQARPRWDVPPVGFVTGDVWPWLFERRLALMVRPVMIIPDEGDRRLVFGVRQLEQAIHYSMHLLENGIWQKDKLRSPAARAYVDRVVARRGAEFELKVAAVAAEAGLTVRHGMTMRSLGAPKQLGDADVLAWDSTGELLFLIECKWFGAARTPREIAGWLQNFRGTGGDKLEKHLGRYAWLRDNLASAAQRLGLGTVPKKLVPLIVTTQPAPLAYVRRFEPGTAVTAIRQLPGHIRSLVEDARACRN